MEWAQPSFMQLLESNQSMIKLGRSKGGTSTRLSCQCLLWGWSSTSSSHTATAIGKDPQMMNQKRRFCIGRMQPVSI